MNTLADVLSARAQWTVIHADNRDVLRQLEPLSVDEVITDPPYSPHTHAKQRRGGGLPDARPQGGYFGESRGGRACISRTRELGFVAVDPQHREFCAEAFARICRRWVLAFSDAESVGEWRTALESFGLQHVRTGAWVKQGSTPQFTGDRPAVGFEAIEIAHRPGRKRWNGRGSHAVWSFPIVLKRGGLRAEPRLHTTQKPLPLMKRLVQLFTDPGDLVFDPFCGSGTTGLACLELGRRFVGVEVDGKCARVAQRRLALACRHLHSGSNASLQGIRIGAQRSA